MVNHFKNPGNSSKKALKEREIEYYKHVIKKMPPFTSFSINAHLRLGKLYAEIGEKESAIHEYSTAALQHAHNGALVKAIAANEVIIELDPGRKDVLGELSYVYFQRGELSEPLDQSFKEELPQRELDHRLANVPLFSYLAPVERQKIAEFLSPVSVKKGTTIIREGEIGECMYLIKSGKVGVYTILMEEGEGSPDEVDQEHLHLATLRDGDFFGEQALITNEPRNATIIALIDVELLQFSKSDLATIVINYPRIGELLRKYNQQRNTATITSLKSAFQKVITQDSSKTV
jgi:CRP-like cAMP-binding protein